MVRRRADPVRRDDHPAARLPRPRALPLHDRRCEHRAAAAAARARNRAERQRRVPRRRDRAAVVPAGRVREDRDHHLPGQLPARHAPAAGHRRAAVPRRHDPAAQALRPAAARLGRGDGDALLHPGHRLVADVLRRVPGGRLRRDEPLLVRRRRARRCSPSGRGSSTTSARRSRTGSTPGSTRSGRSTTRSGGSYQLAQSLFAQADGGLFGSGFGAVAAHDRHGRRQDRPAAGGADRPHLLGHHERARAARRGRGDLHLPARRRARLQDRDARARLVLEAARRPA